MSRRLIFIGLALLAVAGVILALTLSQQEEPADLQEPGDTTTPEPDPLEPMTTGEFISLLVMEEYEKSMTGKEPTMKEGTPVLVLGRVEDFKVIGEYPYFRGEVDLKPYHCSRRVRCIFEGEAVALLQNLERDMDVIIEGRYGGIKSSEFSHDICRLVDCSSLSIESPQTWTVPMAEEMIADAMRGEYLVNWQSQYSKGDIVRVYGPAYSVTIEWGYLEGIWGDVVVTRRIGFGTECKFEGEHLRKIMMLPEGQEVIIEGQYSHGSVSRAFLVNCVLIYP